MSESVNNVRNWRTVDLRQIKSFREFGLIRSVQPRSSQEAEISQCSRPIFSKLRGQFRSSKDLTTIEISLSFRLLNSTKV